MTGQDLLILYAPGARGDFLASVLLQCYGQAADQYRMPEYLCPSYHKFHGLNGDRFEFDIENLSVPCCIRISLNTVSEFLSVAWYWKSKQLPWIPDDQTIVDTLISHERRYCTLDDKFDHVIDFSMLQYDFAVGHVYQRITQKPLPQHLKRSVKQNLSLHQHIDQSNYQHYLPNLDINNVTAQIQSQILDFKNKL